MKIEPSKIFTEKIPKQLKLESFMLWCYEVREGKFFYSGGSKYIKIKLLEIKI